MRVSNLQNDGFIALISSLIVGLVLLFAVVSLGYIGISGRFLLLDIENKKISEGVAEGCVQYAIIKIVNDSAYAVTDHTEPVGTFFCGVERVEFDVPSPGLSTITASSTVRGAVTNLVVTIDNIPPYTIHSWKEIPVYP